MNLVGAPLVGALASNWEIHRGLPAPHFIYCSSRKVISQSNRPGTHEGCPYWDNTRFPKEFMLLKNRT